MMEEASERFWRMVEGKGSDCWNWRGGISNGYGSFYYNGFYFVDTVCLYLVVNPFLCSRHE